MHGPFVEEGLMVASISKADWENYRAVGRVPPSIREVVLQSWQRSSHILSLIHI